MGPWRRRDTGSVTQAIDARPLIPRFAQPAVEAALTDTRVVTINGARQVGKSTLAARIVSTMDRRALTLDDPAVLAAARADPVGFVDHEGLLLIDEIQRCPELLLAIKADVDRRPEPGRYLLTGSAQILTVPRLADSLAGRMEIVELWPLSQGELTGRRERFVADLLAGGEELRQSSDLAKDDYLDLAVRGGFPEAVRRVNSPRRGRWFESYLTTLVQRDIADLVDIERPRDLTRLLRLLAARTAGLERIEGLARDANIPPSTLRRYLALLETAFFLCRIPAWAPSRTTRVVHASKMFIVDSGLAAHLLGATAARLGRPGQDAGPVLETFVTMELRRQLGWSTERATLHHFRTRDGAEVDAVLETPDGRVAGVEVKAGATVRAEDFRGLRRLRDAAGEAFVAGLVLHTGQHPLPFGDGLWAVPISTLWQGS